MYPCCVYVGVVDDLLGVRVVGDVLHVEVHLELGLADLEALGETRTSSEYERRDADRVVRRRRAARTCRCVGVVVRADDRRARVAGGEAEASADLEARARGRTSRAP